jgi:hypothetical protein
VFSRKADETLPTGREQIVFEYQPSHIGEKILA